jgi:tetratricopeptide (TPR) repeat protein
LIVRQKEGQKALDLLAAVAQLDPANARYAYVYALALNEAGQTSTAIETLERNIKLHPYGRDSLAALVSFCDQSGKPGEALTYAQRIYQLDQVNPRVRQVFKTLNGQIHR